MTDKEKQFIEYWEKKRAAGFYRFSFVTGLTYALFVIVFAKLFAWDFRFTTADSMVAVTAILIGILILGPFLWWNRERRYKKIKSKSLVKKAKKKKRRSR